jgi:hypothetical protein
MCGSMRNGRLVTVLMLPLAGTGLNRRIRVGDGYLVIGAVGLVESGGWLVIGHAANPLMRTRNNL